VGSCTKYILWLLWIFSCFDVDVDVLFSSQQHWYCCWSFCSANISYSILICIYVLTPCRGFFTKTTLDILIKHCILPSQIMIYGLILVYRLLDRQLATLGGNVLS
jgi:hypothetical protein